MYCMYILYYSEAQDNRSIYGIIWIYIYICIHVIHLFHTYRFTIRYTVYFSFTYCFSICLSPCHEGLQTPTKNQVRQWGAMFPTLWVCM